MQQYADIYLLLNYCTCTDHTIWGASLLPR